MYGVRGASWIMVPVRAAARAGRPAANIFARAHELYLSARYYVLACSSERACVACEDAIDCRNGLSLEL